MKNHEESWKSMKVMGNDGKWWEIMENHGKSRKLMNNYEISWKSWKMENEQLWRIMKNHGNHGFLCFCTIFDDFWWFMIFDAS